MPSKKDFSSDNAKEMIASINDFLKLLGEATQYPWINGDEEKVRKAHAANAAFIASAKRLLPPVIDTILKVLEECVDEEVK